MKFSKMHGIGNDYVYVNGFEETVADKSAMAIRVSDRHFGIGSDGLIFINPSDKADFEMEMYNSDGSRAEMCGNGIRCVAKYVFDKGMTEKTEFNIETLGGIKKIRINPDESGKIAKSIVVDMQPPILKAEDVPAVMSEFAEFCVDAKLSGNGAVSELPEIGKNAKALGAVVNMKLNVLNQDYGVTCVSMGNPHAVIFIDEPVRDFPLETVGPVFEVHKAFPRHTNTEFVRLIDRKTIEMRVWERGAGETLACGTGACACVVACVLNGLTDNDVTVKLLGGDLKISWDGKADSSVFMEGPAAFVFTGEIGG